MLDLILHTNLDFLELDSRAKKGKPEVKEWDLQGIKF